MTAEHRPERHSGSRTTLTCRADLTRGEIGVGAVQGPTPLTETLTARAGHSLKRESVGFAT
jgi:hypothetical protein